MEIIAYLVTIILVFFAVDIFIKMPIQLVLIKLAGKGMHSLHNSFAFFSSLIIWSLTALIWNKVTGHGIPFMLLLIVILLKLFRIWQLNKMGNQTMIVNTARMDLLGVIIALIFNSVNYFIAWI
jgi:hypothetical protein